MFKCLLIDATFDSCPQIFAQLLGIHAFIHKSYLPRCWVLMPNRLEKTYDRVLIALKELGYKLDPKVGLLDHALRSRTEVTHSWTTH